MAKAPQTCISCKTTIKTIYALHDEIFDYLKPKRTGVRIAMAMVSTLGLFWFSSPILTWLCLMILNWQIHKISKWEGRREGFVDGYMNALEEESTTLQGVLKEET